MDRDGRRAEPNGRAWRTWRAVVERAGTDDEMEAFRWGRNRRALHGERVWQWKAGGWLMVRLIPRASWRLKAGKLDKKK